MRSDVDGVPGFKCCTHALQDQLREVRVFAGQRSDLKNGKRLLPVTFDEVSRATTFRPKLNRWLGC